MSELDELLPDGFFVELGFYGETKNITTEALKAAIRAEIAEQIKPRLILHHLAQRCSHEH